MRLVVSARHAHSAWDDAHRAILELFTTVDKKLIS